MNKRELEARELWVQARIDELMDDEEWVLRMKEKWFYCEDDVNYSLIKTEATEQAEREHASLMADLEDERINAAREY